MGGERARASEGTRVCKGAHAGTWRRKTILARSFLPGFVSASVDILVPVQLSYPDMPIKVICRISELRP